jgi:hypothetical protein
MDDRDTQEHAFLDLSKALGMPTRELKQQLLVLGWNELTKAAQRVEHKAAPDGQAANPQAGLERAARDLLPHLANLPQEAPAAECKGAGYIYVIHDGVSQLSKIGCTSSDGQRQRAIMGAHGSVLMHVLYAQVSDMRAAEAQCHRYFASTRQNGEWFAAELEDIIAFIGREVDWERMSMESMARMGSYLLACRKGDMTAARFALTGPNFPTGE